MDAKGQSTSDRLGRWTVTVTNTKEHLDEVPYLADDLAAMEEKLAKARALESLQESLRSEAQATSKTLREVVSEGEKLRARLGAGLRAKYGFTSETLIKFGFRPRRIPRRKKQEVEKPPPEGQGTAPAK